MNTYEEKQAARKARYEELAKKAEAESKGYANASFEMAHAIPLGQPVHGERDRRYRERIGAKMDKAVEASKKAEYYRNKAESVGRGGISGLDPDAVIKLKSKLSELMKNQDLMKATNKALRLKDISKGNSMLVDLGYSDSAIEKLREPDSYGCIGFSRYMLSNNNANIHRIKNRISALEQAIKVEAESDEEKTGMYTFSIVDGRYAFSFDGKPDSNVRSILKKHGFRWSPTRAAWVRQVTTRARLSVDEVKKELLDLAK